jgi:hypothetical protein
MKALWRANLMLVLNHWLLNRGYILVNDVKALATDSTVRSWFCYRRSVSQPVRLGVRPPFGAHDQILNILWSDNFLLLHVEHPLWQEEGSVIYSAITNLSESCWTHKHILLSHLMSLYLYPPGTGWPSFTPRHWIPFKSLVTTQGSCLLPEVEVEFMTYSQSASPSWCRASICSPWPEFCFLPDNCRCLDVGHPLWLEDGSVSYSYNCFWTLPEQSLSGSSPTELTAIFHCLK